MWLLLIANLNSCGLQVLVHPIVSSSLAQPHPTTYSHSLFQTKMDPPPLPPPPPVVSLSDAAIRGDLPEVMLLVGQHREVVDLGGGTPDKATALHYAAGKGHLDVVKYLLDHGGATIDVQDGDGLTPLLDACNGGHLEVVNCWCQRVLIPPLISLDVP